MRSEAEMLELIKATAREDPLILAAYMEGSRVNPSVPRDIFQDYDIVYIVETTKPYREDRDWIRRFGEILYMQFPEENAFDPSDVENCYGWLVQFTEGNRLDLHVCTKEYALANLELYQILLDKAGILPIPTEATDARYWIKPPRDEEFQSACSDFWWCLNNVAKGLWRREMPYVMDMLNDVVRPQLRMLLEWKIGIENGFSVSAGKSAKYMNRYLPGEVYAQYLATYSEAKPDAVWEAVFTMCDLFRQVSMELSEKTGFSVDLETAQNSLRFLKHVQSLPQDAEAVY